MQGHPEQGEQAEPQHDQDGERPQQQPRAAQHPLQPGLHPSDPLGSRPQGRRQDDHVGPEVEHEPQMAVDRLGHGLAVHLDGVSVAQELRDIGQVALGVAAALDQRQIGLDRHQKNDAEQQRRQELGRAADEQPRHAELVRGEARGHARDQEQQAHPPRMGHQQKSLDPGRGVRALQGIGRPLGVHQAQVVGDQPSKQQHPEGVHVGAALARVRYWQGNETSDPLRPDLTVRRVNKPGT